jgi:hypothetical protein
VSGIAANKTFLRFMEGGERVSALSGEGADAAVRANSAEELAVVSQLPPLGGRDRPFRATQRPTANNAPNFNPLSSSSRSCQGGMLCRTS